MQELDGKESYHFDDDAERVAKALNCTVLLPNHNQLFLDIDGLAELDEFERRLEQLELDAMPDRAVDFKYTKEVLRSRNGNYHVILTFDNLSFSEDERILWQAVLGSDIIREYLNFKRLIWGITNPSRLFRPKEESNGLPLF
jgi:hypothetical protein